jgi:hypothetical protein
VVKAEAGVGRGGRGSRGGRGDRDKNINNFLPKKRISY